MAPSRIEPARYYSQAQLAALIGRDRRTQQVDRANGRLPYFRFGRTVRYLGADLIKFIEAARVGAP